MKRSAKRVDWNYDDFKTEINGMEFRIIAKSDISSFEASAYIPSYTSADDWCNTAYSHLSTEDAILKLVKILEGV